MNYIIHYDVAAFAITLAITLHFYPFRIVKIDKSMVWSAMEDEKAMYALKYTMAMVKAMGMELVAEGVENEDHIRLLTELGCDFFQGYYYSKSVNGELFLERIQA